MSADEQSRALARIWAQTPEYLRRVEVELRRMYAGDIPLERRGMCDNLCHMTGDCNADIKVLWLLFQYMGLNPGYPVEVRWSDVYGTKHEATWCWATPDSRNALGYGWFKKWKGAYGERRRALVLQCADLLAQIIEQKGDAKC